MKKFYAILCLTIASLTQLQAQAPQGFNYQATVRNSSGDLIVNTNVYFKFNVMQGSQTAVPIFTETHYVPTDDLGQVNLVIGQGTANTGIFSELDWSLGSYYLGIELDTGNGYVAMGTTQLLSVPYALYAENSGNASPTTPNLEAVLAENNSANNQQIKDLQDPTDAQDAATKAYVDTEVSNNVQNIEQILTQGNDANGLQLKGIADPTEAQDAVTLAYITQLETSLQDLQNQLQEQNQNIDNDFDGFSENNGDCDDTNAQVYSGAEEICDGLDNDCDDLVDEDAGSIFYQDSDGDGFGGSTTIQSCTQPSGYVVQGGDCNDSDATINPSSVEVCDGIDNNCDGVVDEGLTSTFYQDLDGDGFGSSITVQSCTQLSGYVAQDGDCDDSDATINPNASEIEDGIDNDCDGEIDDGFDVDGDGYSVSQGDCDDNEANVYPGAPEIEDGIDNNCDGIIDEFIDPRDNNIYKTIVVNGNVWLAEDLRFNSENSYNPFYDDPVAGVYSDVRMYWPDDYDAIPEGWRIPTKEEWVALFNFVGGFKDNSSNAYFHAGGKLKSNNPEDWSSDCLDSNIPGTNEVNFNAVSYSFRTLGASGSNTNSTDCNFDGRNQGVGWWSSTENSSFGPNRYWYYYIHLNNNYDGVTYSCSIDGDCDEIFEYIGESKLGNSSDSEHSGRRMLRLIKNQ